MKSKNIRYIFLSYCLIAAFSSCSKQEKTEDGVIKVNEKGIPVMQPLQEDLPKLSQAFINEKNMRCPCFSKKLGLRKMTT